MRITFHKSPFALVLLAVVALMIVVSCSSEEPDVPVPQPSITGDISYTLSNDGNGSGSMFSPAVCQGTHPLHFTVSQTSTYTDTDSSKYTCSPKATVTLQASKDTLHVTDLQTLVTVNATSGAQRSTSGSNPVAHRAVQTFDVGGQVITFDMMYEVYSHVNSAGTTIEMPYIKLNDAKYGAAQTAEVTSAAMAAPMTMANMTVRGIRLTPRPMTGPRRAKTVTTTQAYDVTVSFNMDIETVNTKSPQSQTLSFEVTYAAEVESTIEVPDPTTLFSYQTEVKQGSQSVASPFEVTQGETLSLLLHGTSQCSYFSMEDLESRVITCETTANVIIATGKDTVEYDGDAATLKTVNVETEDVTSVGSDPTWNSCRQVITLGGGQAIVVDWGYQSLGNVLVNDEAVPMPWIKLETPQVQAVTVNEGDNGTAQVTVRLRQDVTLMNLKEPKTETLEYVVRYTAVKEEPKLVKVTYRKDWEWIEAHDNLPLTSHCMVHRDRTYSDGKTYTDTFRDYGKMTTWFPYIEPCVKDASEVTWDGGKIIYYPNHIIESGNGVEIVQSSFGIPDFDHFKFIGFTEDGYINNEPGNWSAYELKKPYANLDLDLYDVTIVGQGLPSDLASGWYNLYAEYMHDVICFRYNPGYSIPGIRGVHPILKGTIGDQFLVIDGMMFTFNEYIEPFEFNEKVEDFPGDTRRGPGKIYTTEVHSRILGKNFYAAAIDTVYTLLPSASPTAWAPMSPAAPWSAADWASNWTQPTTLSSWSNVLTASHCPIPLHPNTAG